MDSSFTQCITHAIWGLTRKSKATTRYLYPLKYIYTMTQPQPWSKKDTWPPLPWPGFAIIPTPPPPSLAQFCFGVLLSSGNIVWVFATRTQESERQLAVFTSYTPFIPLGSAILCDWQARPPDRGHRIVRGVHICRCTEASTTEGYQTQWEHLRSAISLVAVSFADNCRCWWGAV